MLDAKRQTRTLSGALKKVLLQASCLSPFGPAKAVQNGSRQFCDFLGYRFDLPDLGLAEKTITNAVNKVRQPTLFIEREQKLAAPKRAAMLDDYITRWIRWVVAGLNDKPINIVFCNEQMTSQLSPATTI
jgi:hypothetical protein